MIDGHESLMKRRTGQARASSRSAIAITRAGESARGRGQSLHERGGVAGNSGSPAGRINAALE